MRREDKVLSSRAATHRGMESRGFPYWNCGWQLNCWIRKLITEMWWAFLVSYPTRPLSVNIELNCFANSCVAKYFLIAVKKVWRHGYRCVENAYGQALEQTGLPFKRKSMRISIQLNGSQPRQYVVVAPMPTRKLSTHAEILGAEKKYCFRGL